MSNEQYVTTAATAELEASTAKLAKEVEINAAAEKNVAAEAAAAAKVRIPSLHVHVVIISLHCSSSGQGHLLDRRFHSLGEDERDDQRRRGGGQG